MGFTDIETKLRRKLFGKKGIPGSLKALFWSNIPKGLTRETMLHYGEMTRKVLAAGKDRTGTQWWRRWVVQKTLFKMRVNEALGLSADSVVAGGAVVSTIVGALTIVVSLAVPMGDASLPPNQGGVATQATTSQQAPADAKVRKRSEFKSDQEFTAWCWKAIEECKKVCEQKYGTPPTNNAVRWADCLSDCRSKYAECYKLN